MGPQEANNQNQNNHQTPAKENPKNPTLNHNKHLKKEESQPKLKPKQKQKPKPLKDDHKTKLKPKQKQTKGNGGVKMGTTFAPEEIVEARDLRSISQKKLKNTLHEVEKLGIHFNDGVSGVMLEYGKYKALVERIETLEEALDDLYLTELFKERRTDLAEKEWIERKPGQGLLQFLEENN